MPNQTTWGELRSLSGGRPGDLGYSRVTFEDGCQIPGAIQQLLDHPRINDATTPSSAGGAEAAELQGGANSAHESDPGFDTADFADSAPGNLRADYVLPSRNLRILDSGVFWPAIGEPGAELTGVFPFPSSDHRLVWVDLRNPGR